MLAWLLNRGSVLNKCCTLSRPFHWSKATVRRVINARALLINTLIAPVAACREGSEVPVSTTFNVNTGPVPASVRNGTGMAAAPAPAPAAVASVKNGKCMAAAPASDNEDVPTSPVDTDDESAYWSPDDSGKPWNYGFGDGYIRKNQKLYSYHSLIYTAMNLYYNAKNSYNCMIAYIAIYSSWFRIYSIDSIWCMISSTL